MKAKPINQMFKVPNSIEGKYFIELLKKYKSPVWDEVNGQLRKRIHGAGVDPSHTLLAAVPNGSEERELFVSARDI